MPTASVKQVGVIQSDRDRATETVPGHAVFKLGYVVRLGITGQWLCHGSHFRGLRLLAVSVFFSNANEARIYMNRSSYIRTLAEMMTNSLSDVIRPASSAGGIMIGSCRSSMYPSLFLTWLKCASLFLHRLLRIACGSRSASVSP